MVEFNFDEMEITKPSTQKPSMSDIDKISHIVGGENYFITGSVAFGCQHKESDLDVCFPIMSKTKILQYLYKSDIKVTPSNYNLGVKFVLQQIKFNFIFLHPLEYCAWSKATKMIIAGSILQETTPKKVRYPIFELLCSSYKLALVNVNVNTSNYHNYM